MELTTDATVAGQAVALMEAVEVSRTNGVPIVRGIDLALRPGMVLGLVGESGSGKTTTALALLGYTRPGLRITSGRILVGGVDAASCSAAELRELRGSVVAYVPQDPQASLNPSMRVREIVAEMLRAHRSREDLRSGIAAALQRVGLPADDAFLNRYPHQISGGQQQRVAIAAATACEPSVLVLDEPTTGLDAETARSVMAEVDALRRRTGMAIVLVSHDLEVVKSIADEVAVMYGGLIVECGPAGELVADPSHPYTVGLLEAIPDSRRPTKLRGIPGVAAEPGTLTEGCVFAPRCAQRVAACETISPQLSAIAPNRSVRCPEWTRTPAVRTDTVLADAAQTVAEPVLEVRDLCVQYQQQGTTLRVVDEVSFVIRAGERVAVLGVSGSGKTSIGRCVAGLRRPSGGSLLLDGQPIAAAVERRTREQLRAIQIVFQNPAASLNPRRPVGQAVARPGQVLCGLDAAGAEREARRYLELLRLRPEVFDRYPSQLSGGEKQRVAIARALIVRPRLLICDEVTSALDVSVQAALVELLRELSSELSMALLFISHDLGVVCSIAERALVVEGGSLVSTLLTATTGISESITKEH